MQDLEQLTEQTPPQDQDEPLITKSRWGIVGERAPLFEAMAKAQKNFEAIFKTETGRVQSQKGNYEYDYATLAGTISAVRDALNDQGMALWQPPSIGDGQITIHTLITHSSGSYMWAEATFEMPFKEWRDDKGNVKRAYAWQDAGSSITYCRRYSLGILGVAPTDDNDAQSAPDMGRPPPTRQPPPTPKPKATPPKKPEEPLARQEDPSDAAARAMLEAAAHDYPPNVMNVRPIEQADPPAETEALYNSDPKFYQTFMGAIRERRINGQAAEDLKRFIHQKWGITPEQWNKQFTMSQARVTLDAILNAPVCQCQAGKPCQEKGRLKA